MNDYYLEKSNKKNKKYMVHFINPETKRINTIYFGQAGASDYTIHKDDNRKLKYINRHSKMNEDWNNPLTAGFWSRWLLWNKPSLKASIKNTENQFNIKIHLID
jgi:hypothetical protein